MPLIEVEILQNSRLRPDHICLLTRVFWIVMKLFLRLTNRLSALKKTKRGFKVRRIRPANNFERRGVCVPKVALVPRFN